MAEKATEAALGTAQAVSGSFYTQPEFFVALAFVIFVVAVAKPAWKVVSGALDKRADTIRQQIDEATRLQDEAQALLADYQRRQRNAVKEAEEIATAAREDSQRHSAELAGALETSLERREQMALDRIARAESQAVKEVRDMAIDIAIAATGKLLVEGLDEKRGAAMIDEAVKDLPAKLH